MQSQIESTLRSMEHVSELYILVDQNFRIVSANGAFLNYFGISAEQITNYSARKILGHMKESPNGFKFKPSSSNRLREINLPEEKPLKILYSEVFTDEQTQNSEPLLGLILGKTKQTPEPNNLSIHEEQIHIILEAIVDPAIMINDRGIILGLNQPTVRVFGYERQEIIGKNVSTLMPEPIAREHDGYLKSYKENRMRKIIGIGREVTGRRKDGGHIPLHLSVGELLTSRNKKVFIGTLSDLSQRDALMAAKAASEAKDLFLANMSHELRTPLNAILTFSQLLLSSDLKEDQRPPLENILKAGRKLLHEVEQILTISKLEAKKHILEFVSFDLSRCIRSIIAMQQPDRGMNLRVNLVYHSGTPELIHSDPYALVTILSNLLSNALKFTKAAGESLDGPEKKVTIEVSLDPKRPQQILYSVSDEGIGISEEKQEHIFLAFSQEDLSTTRIYGGTGLGLAIVNRLVQALEGSIELKSEKGLGSTFHVSLPFKNVEEGESLHEIVYQDGSTDLPSTSELEGHETVLVAEDDEFNMLALEGVLSKLGFGKQQIYWARDGAEAVQKARENVFSLILMDRQMPKMDGIDATKVIRSQSLNMTTPIIALTAAVLEKSKQLCLDAGMNDFCGKPIHVPTLRQKLKKWLPVHHPPQEKSGADIRNQPPLDQNVLNNFIDEFGRAKLTSMIGAIRQVFSKNSNQISEVIDKAGSDEPDECLYQALYNAAHTLKGSPVGILGGNEFNQITLSFYERVCSMHKSGGGLQQHKTELLSWQDKINKSYLDFIQSLEGFQRVELNQPPKKPEKETILIADDDLSNLIFLQSLLEKDGYKVIPTDNGKTALEKAISDKPDLLILDVQMPGYSGHEVCQIFRERSEYKEVPVIFGTATVSDDEGVARGFEVGGSDYISKPYTNRQNELLARVGTHLKLRRMNQDLKTTLDELKSTQSQLLEAAHQAGMADIAGNILHNIGNVLNSVSISTQAMEAMNEDQKSNVEAILKISNIIIKNLISKIMENENPNEKGVNEAEDVLSKRCEILMENILDYSKELNDQFSNLQKIRKFLKISEKLTSGGKGKEFLFMKHPIRELLELEISSLSSELERHQIKVDLMCPDEEIRIQINKFQFIIQALLANSLVSLVHTQGDRHLSITGEYTDDLFTITIEDTGYSLPTNPNRIFMQNYKDPDSLRPCEDLHICLNFAKQMKGELYATPNLSQQGARFVIKLPTS